MNDELKIMYSQLKNNNDMYFSTLFCTKNSHKKMSYIYILYFTIFVEIQSRI